MTKTLAEGTLTFTVESRVLRELGERLVKEPEVALVELVKNAHDADALECHITTSKTEIVVSDDGHGMTLPDFEHGWMRIGTSAKANQTKTRRFKRTITGEKGIGRFAVRFLGRTLRVRSVAWDSEREIRTVLTADFNWPKFDRSEDLGDVKVPYTLETADDGEKAGTLLTISSLRPSVDSISWRKVLGASLSLVSPFRALLAADGGRTKVKRKKGGADPGFQLLVGQSDEPAENLDIGNTVLGHAVLRASGRIRGNRLQLTIANGRTGKKHLSIADHFPNSIGDARFDVRYFPTREGTFTDMPIPGHLARGWVKENHGVAVFDRGFRVLPYGTPGDDWLKLAADVSIRIREPKSSIAARHFPMSEEEKGSTKTNYMLRLPHPRQLVGVVQVEGRRSSEDDDGDRGLIAAADREGFVDNAAFSELFDLVRGAIEAIASVDKELQIRAEKAEAADRIRVLRTQTREAIRDVEKNPNIRAADKARIVEQLVETQELVEAHEERTQDTQAKLEIMSLLGVVAGFMTHEFGVAMDALRKARSTILPLSKKDPHLREVVDTIDVHIKTLGDFVTYSQAYIKGAAALPSQLYRAKPRIDQVVRVFGKYAGERDIKVTLDVPGSLDAPLVPVSLYNGICLNLYTNALKAVTAKAGPGARRIHFKASNSSETHTLVVSDTGIGIPGALRERVFDPLFTTTSGNRDPLGSGMGLGLTLVKRAVESYDGTVEVVTPTDGFTTSVQVTFPVAAD